MDDSDDESCTVPLRDQRYFGAGLKRKRVQFVSSSESTTPAPIDKHASDDGLTASDKYLSVVFKRARSEPSGSSAAVAVPVPQSARTDHEPRGAGPTTELDSTIVGRLPDAAEAIGHVCSICSLPMVTTSGDRRHESSLAHQVCLPHIHPPSSLDRRRKGLSVLQAYGWDPDQRLGLGATGKGILHPVKASDKKDRYGLGVAKEESQANKRRNRQEAGKVVQKLDAGKVRKLDAESRKKDQQMREMFYRDDEVEKYLGGG